MITDARRWVVSGRQDGARARWLHRGMQSLARAIGAAARHWFGERHLEKALVLESLAACPALIVGTLRTLRAQRRLEEDALAAQLLGEIEHERAHTLLFAALVPARTSDRVLVTLGQVPLVLGLAMLLAISEPAVHRLCAYFEEEAIDSYVRHRAAMRRGAHDPVLPAWALERWSLPAGATLSALLPTIEAEEAAHRDLHHALADGGVG